MIGRQRRPGYKYFEFGKETYQPPTPKFFNILQSIFNYA